MTASERSPSEPAADQATDLVVGTSLWADAWKRLRRNRMAVASGGLILLLAVACLVGPPLIAATWGYDEQTQDLAYGPQPPSWEHPFGTDFYGRDLLVRVLSGGRVSLTVGFLAALVAATIGTVYGAVSSYAGGLVDAVMMRAVDVLYALPYMFLVIILVTILGKSLLLVFLALGAVGWLLTARVVRGQVMSLKQQDFVLAAKSLGTPGRDIVFRHLIPNTLGPVIVTFTLTVPSMILQEAFLSFLGLGVQAPRASLGALINDGANQMLVFWWTLVFPGSVMAVMLFALNFLGDGVRDALDPRMRR
ncbi:MAG: ABC transporter permease [Planctomycetota bacterium]|nr:ABC transporter permease [Pirellulales bacterium]MDA0253592.1 ABC transporter permease [Planctomycetota bacterium]MDA1201849.1 ABC transporter permease [Planctomycetota bacterium]